MQPHISQVSSRLKSAVMIASMLGISSLIGVEFLRFTSPELPMLTIAAAGPYFPAPIASPQEDQSAPLPSPSVPAPTLEPLSGNSVIPKASSDESIHPATPPLPPLSALPQPPDVDVTNDPIYKELLKSLQSPRSGMAPLPSTDSPSSDGIEIAEEEWEAIEQILQTARSLKNLEDSYRKQKNTKKADSIRATVNRLRLTALELMKPNEPAPPFPSF